MSILPIPNSKATQISRELTELIKSQEQDSGALSFADYMQNALYAPGYGYYRNGLQKFGEHGDFITAPDQFPIFSHTLATQCIDIMQNLNGDIGILEIGAGSGRLALELLNTLQDNNYVPHTYYILEPCAELRARQQTLLSSLPVNIKWLSTLPETPLTGIIIANEVIDAMPVHRFKIENGAILENMVKWDDGFKDTFDDPISAKLASQVDKLLGKLNEPLPDQYLSEINLWVNEWIKSLADCLSQGVMLFIDYGFPEHEYYHPSRSEGTLMCHYQHHAHSDPYYLPGLQDITAHVNFTQVANAALAAKLHVAGYTTQAWFLLNCGIANHAHSIATNQAIKMLTHPHEMGELFKVIALSQGYDAPIIGFSAQDMRHKL